MRLATSLTGSQLCDLELDAPHVGNGHAPFHIEDLDPDDFVVGVVVEDDARHRLLGVGDRTVVEAEVECVRFLVEMNLHRCLRSRRSKKAVTTRTGSSSEVYTTRRMRPLRSSMVPSACRSLGSCRSASVR